MHQISEDAQPFENLNEQKRKFDARDHSSRVNVTFVADADQRSYENITRDPALKKLPGFLGLGRTIFHSRKGKAEFTFRAANNVSKVGMNEKDEGKFKKLLKKHGLKLVDTMYEGYEMRGLGSKGLRNTKVSKKVNAEKIRKVLTTANIPHDMVMGTIRVPERFVRIAKKKLDDAFGGMFQKKTGFKISGTLKEGVEQVDEEINESILGKLDKVLDKVERKLDRLARAYNNLPRNKAKIDRENKERMERVLKNFDKMVADLDRAYAHVDEDVQLDEKKLPTARKIVSGLGDADGPFTVVVMKNKKVIHQESTKFAKMLPAIVKELAEKMPNTTIGIENKTGKIVKVFK